MNTTLKHALWGAALAGGITLLGATAANAADNTTDGDGGIGSGNQVVLGITAPVTITDNAIAGIGDASTSGGGSDDSSWGVSTGSNETSGEAGLLGGNQVALPVTLGITGSGNAVTVVGDSSSTGAAPAPAAAPAVSSAGGNHTTGAKGVASGNQVIVPVYAPVTVSHNALTLVGDSTVRKSTGAGTAPKSAPAAAGGNVTSGQGGVLSGNQLIAPVYAPVTVSHNAVSVIGDAMVLGGGSTTAPAGGVTSGGNTTNGAGGLLSGNQLVAPVYAPVTIDGNAVTVIGDSTVENGQPGTPGTPGQPGTPGTPGHPGTSGHPATGTFAGAGSSAAPRLASTGSDAFGALLLAFLGAFLAAGGFLIRRRA